MTVDGATHALERPFLVIATQNPVEYEGTYPLPEAQLDRFAVRMTIGYPPLADEARMLAEQTTEPPLDTLQPVARRAELVDGDRGRPPRPRRRERHPLRRRAPAPHAGERPPRARRQPALGDRAARARKGPGARRAARLRAARGRPGARRDRARTSADPRARGACDGHRRGGGRRRGARGHAGAGVRLRGAGLLAVGVVVAAWAVGSTALAVLGLGLCLAVALAARLGPARRPQPVRRATPPSSTPVEGEALALEAQLRGRRLLASRLEWRERIGTARRAGATVRRGGRARARRRRRPAGPLSPRPGRLVAGDPLGLRTRRARGRRRRRRFSSARASRSSRRSSPRRGRGATAVAARRCGVRAASSRTACASTSRASRFGPSTGRPPRGAAS